LEKREWQKWVGCDNSPLPKAVIHYWRNRIGFGDQQSIGTGGWFGVEYAHGYGEHFPAQSQCVS
jgi:hypothetical protein